MVVLTDDTFDAAVQHYGSMVVEFYAPVSHTAALHRPACVHLFEQ